MTIANSLASSARQIVDTLSENCLIIEKPVILFGDSGLGVLTGAIATVSLGYILKILNLPIFTFCVPDDELAISSWEWTQFAVANRSIATNAGIKQPNELSVELNIGGSPFEIMLSLNAIMLTFGNLLDKYTANGGTFTYITPAYIYNGCVFKKLIVKNSKRHPGQTYRLELMQPLVSIAGLGGLVPNNSISKFISGGLA